MGGSMPRGQSTVCPCSTWRRRWATARMSPPSTATRSCAAFSRSAGRCVPLLSPLLSPPPLPSSPLLSPPLPSLPFPRSSLMRVPLRKKRGSSAARRGGGELQQVRHEERGLVGVSPRTFAHARARSQTPHARAHSTLKCGRAGVARGRHRASATSSGAGARPTGTHCGTRRSSTRYTPTPRHAQRKRARGGSARTAG